ncbi:MAG: hypothetical protein HY823_03100 [Acidobacteria bacterium]|nr:hypothetical protein [Acidobacteriota bacterium]
MPFSATLLGALLAAPVLVAQGASILPLQEVRVGMKGQGRTVFKGGKIERFDFEVLGVSRNMMGPGRGLILIKASGGPLAESGIAKGMSGSPCYIDGKLVGALSIGFPFEKEPIGGITPIQDMLEQLKEIPDTPALKTPLIIPKLDPPKVLKSALLGRMIPFNELAGIQGGEEASTALLPVSGSEFLPEARAFFQGMPFAWSASSAAGGSQGGEASPVEPGGMATAMLIQGDLELGASGTITTQDQNRVTLFGHPLANQGAVDLPLWSATVATVVPGYNESFKLALPVAPIGALRLDRSSGVAGVLGATARTVPLRLGVNLGGKRTLNFRFDLIDHPTITPAFAAGVLVQTLSTHVRGLGLQSLSLQGNIKVANHPALQIENVIADISAQRLGQYVGAFLQGLMLNPFERPQIEGISLNVKAEERLDFTFVAGVRTLKARVKRGEVLPVVVTLQNMQGVREFATFNVGIAASAQPGKATLLVGDGLSLIAADPDERAIEVSSLGDVVRLLNGALKNNHAYALLVQSQAGAGLRGARIEGVPPTVTNLLLGDGDTSANRIQRRIVGRSVLPLEREVRGLVQLELEIE